MEIKKGEAAQITAEAALLPPFPLTPTPLLTDGLKHCFYLKTYFSLSEIPSCGPSKKGAFEIIGFFGPSAKIVPSPSIEGDQTIFRSEGLQAAVLAFA